MITRAAQLMLVLAGLATLSGCSRGIGDGLFSRDRAGANGNESSLEQQRAAGIVGVERDTIFDLFDDAADPNVTVEVNRYIWNAAQEVLNFLPVQAVDPFSGVIVYGFGTPPGGGRAYRATVYVQDPALDARSLNVALATRAGPVDAATQRAIEDAILTRARQLRIASGRF